MDRKEQQSTRDYYTVDLIHIMRMLWRRIWVIAISGFLAAAIGFSISTFIITPEYSSSIMLYVNNSSFSLGNTNFSISSSEISAAQSLVKTYSVLLENRTTLERVREKAKVNYSYEELEEMIVASSANGTEIMKVTVTTNDPYESSRIANSIAEVLPVRISEVVDGASMEVVDNAVPVFEKVAPSITKFTAVGLIIGIFLSLVALIIMALLDDTVHDEEYVLQTYSYPILAKVPDLLDSGTKQYGYYSQRKSKPRN